MAFIRDKKTGKTLWLPKEAHTAHLAALEGARKLAKAKGKPNAKA